MAHFPSGIHWQMETWRLSSLRSYLSSHQRNRFFVVFFFWCSVCWWFYWKEVNLSSSHLLLQFCVGFIIKFIGIIRITYFIDFLYYSSLCSLQFITALNTFCLNFHAILSFEQLSLLSWVEGVFWEISGSYRRVQVVTIVEDLS